MARRGDCLLAAASMTIHRKFCIQCGHLHWTEPARCPACQGVREAARIHLLAMCPSVPINEHIFEHVFGREG